MSARNGPVQMCECIKGSYYLKMTLYEPPARGQSTLRKNKYMAQDYVEEVRGGLGSLSEDVINLREQKIRPQGVDSLIMSAIQQHHNDIVILDEAEYSPLCGTKQNDIEIERSPSPMCEQDMRLHNMVDQCIAVLKEPSLYLYYQSYLQYNK